MDFLSQVIMGSSKNAQASKRFSLPFLWDGVHRLSQSPARKTVSPNLLEIASIATLIRNDMRKTEQSPSFFYTIPTPPCLCERSMRSNHHHFFPQYPPPMSLRAFCAKQSPPDCDLLLSGLEIASKRKIALFAMASTIEDAYPFSAL